MVEKGGCYRLPGRIRRISYTSGRGDMSTSKTFACRLRFL